MPGVLLGLWTASQSESIPRLLNRHLIGIQFMTVSRTTIYKPSDYTYSTKTSEGLIQDSSPSFYFSPPALRRFIVIFIPLIFIVRSALYGLSAPIIGGLLRVAS